MYYMSPSQDINEGGSVVKLEQELKLYEEAPQVTVLQNDEGLYTVVIYCSSHLLYHIYMASTIVLQYLSGYLCLLMYM